jgi:phytoene desaturase
MKEIFVERKIPTDPSIYTFNPSSVDSTLAPEGKSVMYVLVPVPSETSIDWANQDAFVEDIILRLEKKGFPNLREKILWKKVRTPKDALREGLYAGGSFGIAPSLFQSGPFRPQVQPYKEKNVFAVGASIHPGGGIPIVMQGAKTCADVVTTYLKGRMQHESHR